MSTVRIAVIFYSTFGTNHAIALEAAKAAEAAGAEVRLRRCAETAPDEVVDAQDAWREQLEEMKDIPEVSLDDMEWADGFLFSFPTRFGDAPSQVRAFIDTLGPLWQKGKLANKTLTACTSAQNPHGGQETTLLAFYTTAMHWGSIVVTPGYTADELFESGGNPYGYSASAGEFDEKGRAAVTHQAERLVMLTERLARRDYAAAA